MSFFSYRGPQWNEKSWSDRSEHNQVPGPRDTYKNDSKPSKNIDQSVFPVGAVYLLFQLLKFNVIHNYSRNANNSVITYSL